MRSDGKRSDDKRSDDKRRGPPQPKLYEYRLPGDWEVLAGRTDRDNDTLSLKIARPNDWWFHVRSQPGSHVVLRVPRGREPDRAVLAQAAAVAAWHSRLRQSRQVAVSCTRARYVTKPRGASAGTVEIRREKVIKVRPELPRGAAESADTP